MRSYGWGFRLLTAFAAEWWGPPEETGGDGRRREASPQSYLLFAAAHTPVYAGACTIPQNARAFCGTPIPLGSVPLLASVERNPLICGLRTPHCAPSSLVRLRPTLRLRTPHRAPSSLVRLRPTLRLRTPHCAPSSLVRLRTPHCAPSSLVRLRTPHRAPSSLVRLRPTLRLRLVRGY